MSWVQYEAFLVECSERADRDLAEIAQLLDCTIEKTLCNGHDNPWQARIRLRNNKSKRPVQWVKSPSDHSYNFGAMPPDSATYTLPPVEKERNYRIANLKASIQARDFFLSGGFSIRMSKTRKVAIPKVGSIEELRFIFEVEGRAG